MHVNRRVWPYCLLQFLYTSAPAIAVFARTNLINTVSGQPYSSIQWFSNWEKTGLLKFNDKNADGLIQYVADAQLNELVVDRDIMVLANLKLQIYPHG